MVKIAINNLQNAIKGERLISKKLPWVLLEKRVGTTPLYFKCGEHGHYVIIFKN